jgi:AP2 domain
MKCSAHKQIKLTKNKVALVDNEDYDRQSRFSWYTVEWSGRFFACRDIDHSRRKKTRQTAYLHNEISQPAPGLMVQHRDGDTLNNCRGNLRNITPLDYRHSYGLNRNNTSGFKGVSWHKCAQKWAAEITTGGKKIYLGIFTDIIDAARAYDNAAIEYYGAEFARLNVL